ncbi:hypothetical protein U1Q18_030609 [Sarracenia purpurea var. burkii]
MMLLVQTLFHSHKLSSKLENHHHHHHSGCHHHNQQSKALTAFFQAFQADVSNCISKLLTDSKPRPELLSLSWIHECLELLPNANRAFAKLVIDIDYPMSKWEVPCMEEYLRYSLKLLELLNSISSCVSHLGQARLSMSHALSLSLAQASLPVAIERLRGNQFKILGKINLTVEEDDLKEKEERPCFGEEGAINQALMVMKSVGYWVCGIVLTALSGDVEPYSEMKRAAGELLGSSMAADSGFCAATEKNWNLKEVKEVGDQAACLIAGGEGGGVSALSGGVEPYSEMKKGAGELLGSLIMAVDLGFCKATTEKKWTLKEVKEVEDAAACLVTAMGNGGGEGGGAAELMKRKLKVVQVLLDAVGKEADGVFSEILAGRNELIDSLRRRKL